MVPLNRDKMNGGRPSSWCSELMINRFHFNHDNKSVGHPSSGASELMEMSSNQTVTEEV